MRLQLETWIIAGWAVAVWGIAAVVPAAGEVAAARQLAQATDVADAADVARATEGANATDGAAATDIEVLTRWMSGSFSSSRQAALDDSYIDVRLEMIPIWKGRGDGPWFYVEQAVASNAHRPYRQRVYRLVERSGGSIESLVYSIPEPLRFAAAWQRAVPLAGLAPDSLVERDGCSVFLSADAAGFAGSTRGSSCSSNLRGAAYATSEVRVTPTRMISWDRGFNDDGMQVWGATAGPYVFDKTASAAMRRPWSETAPIWGARARFADLQIDECSGIVASRRYPRTYWVHNDSGDRPRIFAVDAVGGVRSEYLLDRATNVDWEDIAIDDAGHLYVCDAGNNDNDRSDLVIYVVREPDPDAGGGIVPVERRIRFRYPDQTTFPDPRRNHDCEAAFWQNGSLYLLTKHRTDTWTRLYRLDPMRGDEEQVAALLDSLDAGSAVTAADLSPDRRELAILCYDYVILADVSRAGERMLSRATVRRLLFEGKQSEAISHDGDVLRIANEQGEIHLLEHAAVVEAAEQAAAAGADDRPQGIAGGYLPPTPRVAAPLARAIALPLRAATGELNEPAPAEPAFAILTCSEDRARIDLSWDALAPASEASEPTRILAVAWGAPSQRVAPGPDDHLWEVVLSDGGFAASPIGKTAPLPAPEIELRLEDGRVRGSMTLSVDWDETAALNLNLFADGAGDWCWGGDWAMRGPLNPFLWGQVEIVP